MPKRKSKPKKEYDFLHLEVLSYTASTDACINYDVRDPHRYHDEARVYSFTSSVTLDCIQIWPEEREGWDYHLTIYGREADDPELGLTLDDCHVRDDQGRPQYRKRGGRSKPVYKVPKGVGLMEKVRGKDAMSGTCWVSPSCMSDMLTLLLNVEPLYVHIHEMKEGRNRWISGITLQTDKPE